MVHQTCCTRRFLEVRLPSGAMDLEWDHLSVVQDVPIQNILSPRIEIGISESRSGAQVDNLRSSNDLRFLNQFLGLRTVLDQRIDFHSQNLVMVVGTLLLVSSRIRARDRNQCGSNHEYIACAMIFGKKAWKMGFRYLISKMLLNHVSKDVRMIRAPLKFMRFSKLRD